MSYRSDDCSVEIGRKSVHLRSAGGKESIRQTLTNVEEESTGSTSSARCFSYFFRSSETEKSPISAAPPRHRSIISLFFFPLLSTRLRRNGRNYRPLGSLDPDCQQEPWLAEKSRICNAIVRTIQSRKGAGIFDLADYRELSRFLYSLSARVSTFFISLPRLAAFSIYL